MRKARGRTPKCRETEFGSRVRRRSQRCWLSPAFLSREQGGGRDWSEGRVHGPETRKNDVAGGYWAVIEGTEQLWERAYVCVCLRIGPDVCVYMRMCVRARLRKSE
eukprot:4879999-Pleurochrysis_carterae.AAC.1